MANEKTNLDKSMKNIQSSIDQMYKTTYYNSPFNTRQLDRLYDGINRHIDGITNYNMDTSGTPTISRIYSRLQKSIEKNVGGVKTNDIGDLFDNAIGFDDFYSNFMQNRYLVEVDAEIDAVCKYFPELLEALEVKKEGVLSADHFSKDFLTLKKSNTSDDDATFDEEAKDLKEKYDLLNLVDEIYDTAAKYGEQFLYVVPYSIALAKLLSTKPNTDILQKIGDRGAFSEAVAELLSDPSNINENEVFSFSIEKSRFTVALGESNSRSAKKNKSIVLDEACVAPTTVTKGNKSEVKMAPVLDAAESFKLDVEICKTGIIESAVKSTYLSVERRSHLSESCASEFNSTLSPIQEKKGGLEIVQKNKTTGELQIRGKEDPLIANTTSDGLFDINGNTSLKKEVKPLDVPGCVVSKLKREQVIPLVIGNSTKALGYYYIELRSVEAMQDFQGYNYIMSDSLTSIRGSNSGSNAPFNVVDPMRQEQLLQYIAGQLSKFIDKQFIQANQDLTEEIYMILKQNDLFNTPSIDKIKVTFVPPEDMHHLFFKMDPITHRGISDLEKAMVPAKIYACMYITDAIAQMVRGQDRRVFYIRQNVETNISKTLMNTIQQIKQGNFGLRQFSNINNVLNMTGKFNDFVIPTNSSGDSPVDIQVLQGQQFTDNTDRMNQLKEMAITSTDVPFEMIQTRQSVDYAMQLSMSSSRFLRKIYHRQGQYTPFLSRLITKLYNYEYRNRDKLDVVLPPPMFLNMANTNQLVDNIKQFVTTVSEYDVNGMSDDALKNTYMKELFKYYVGTHVELSEHEKILKKSMALTKLESKDEEDNDNGY